MLNQIDRIQIATDQAEKTAELWSSLLGAEESSRDRVDLLSARRITCALGRGFIEFLEPDGSGPVDAALKRRGRPHLFAAGVATSDFDALMTRLQGRNADVGVEKGQAFLNPSVAIGANCPIVISPVQDRTPVGLIDYLYEATLLVGDSGVVVTRVAELFDLNAGNFVPIKSDRFAYNGQLTLFHPDRLHRFEIITPTDESKTMGRFFKQNGPSYYMCFAETPHMKQIEERAAKLGAGITIDRPEERPDSLPADQMWLHPPALGGVMLGLSRPSMAWTWSGSPHRVQPLAGGTSAWS